MCGIIGILNGERSFVEAGLKLMQNRGSDNSSIVSLENNHFGHNLHAIIGYVPQPIETDTHIFATNCEIYNWKELNDKYSFDAHNDAEVLLQLILTNNLEEADGVYAFSLFDKTKNTITLGRDLFGIKPLFYSYNTTFSFASEKKALENPVELNPRQTITFNQNSQEISISKRDFITHLPEHAESKEEIMKTLEHKILTAVTKRVPDQKVGVLFSGGIDSTLIAFILKKNKIPFTCYTAAITNMGEEAQDLYYAKKIAAELDFELVVKTITLEELEDYIKTVSTLIESSNVIKVGVALPFFVASEAASEDNIRVIFSGLGSEEIFAGYERHAASAGISTNGYDTNNVYEDFILANVNKECISGLMQIHERDLYRDDVVTMFNKIELRLPFLDRALVEYAIKIPGKFKITKEEKKIILREVAENLGLPTEYARRPKKAAQYGSKFDKALGKLAKKQGLNKSEYLAQFYTEKNLKLGSLISSGKDSLYAAYIMQQRNYEITCFLTIESSNTESYMFHTPNINLAAKQAEVCNKPILVQKTEGKKEEELRDLKTLLANAKKEFGIQGVVSGALFSTYQRDRIEIICDELGLVSFTPLWHKDQKSYMQELVDNKFEFLLSAIAADGLTEKWLGKIITSEDVIALGKIPGIQPAGEGGEFESFVVNCPMFSRPLNIKKALTIMESENTGIYQIEEIQ
jgi:diphthine-ammonia ligase